MLHNKEEYFELSRRHGLPTRCPLLQRCERRAHTLALANNWPLDKAASFAELDLPIVGSVGEPAYLIGGKNNFIVGGQCPEVGLFETTMAIIGLNGMPVTMGQYDKYTDPQYEVLETGHFSECAEYALYSKEQTRAVISQNEEASWISRNYQWIIATIVALAGTLASFLALK